MFLKVLSFGDFMEAFNVTCGHLWGLGEAWNIPHLKKNIKKIKKNWRAKELSDTLKQQLSRIN